MANLASTYWSQGHWKEAEELDVQVMKTRKWALGEEHPHTLSNTANLAHTLYVQKCKKKAIRLMTDVVKCRTEKVGAHYPVYGMSRNQIVIICNVCILYQGTLRYRSL